MHFVSAEDHLIAEDVLLEIAINELSASFDRISRRGAGFLTIDYEPIFFLEKRGEILDVFQVNIVGSKSASTLPLFSVSFVSTRRRVDNLKRMFDRYLRMKKIV